MISRIGRYEVQSRLGRGGFGVVFRAFDPTVRRQVAIKLLLAAGEPEFLDRFHNEAAATGKLRHQNIVTIYDFGEHEGSAYLVMELLEGEDLQKIITARRPLSLLRKALTMSQVADGLNHAHINGIVHRDVKPANIMLLNGGGVKIMDFGIALLTQETAARLTPQGSMLGSIPYMAPEQFQGVTPDALTDIFAFGVTCYEMLTGSPPFDAGEAGVTIYNILNKVPAPIRSLNPECPEALEEAVVRMLAKDRSARYQTLEDVQFDLEPIIADLRNERLNELLAEARTATENSRFQEALLLVRQALEIEPTNRSGREMREALQRLIRDREIRTNVGTLLTEGREQMDARQFDQALQRFESALRLDSSNAEIHAVISEARGLWQSVQKAEKLVEEARRALDRGDLTGAHQMVSEAVASDPRNAGAAPILANVRERIEKREAERRLREGLANARGLVLLQNFEGALELLELLRVDYPESNEVRQLITRATTDREVQARKQFLQSRTDEAKELLRQGQYDSALERLSALRKDFPESPELAELASYAEEEVRARRQAEAVARVLLDAGNLTSAARFDTATERVKAALVEYPTAAPLRDLLQNIAALKAAHQRQSARNAAFAQASSAIEGERFAEAIACIAAFVGVYGDVAELEALRSQAAALIERQRRIEAIRGVMTNARTLLDQGNAGGAADVLGQATRKFPDDPELAQLLGMAQDQHRERQRSDEITSLIADAESLARARHFESALELLDSALGKYSGAERLLRCRDAIIASRDASEREREASKVLEKTQDLLDRGETQAAVQHLEAASVIYPDRESVARLLAKAKAILQQQLREAEEARLLEERQVRQAIEHATRLLERDDALSAIKFLRKAADENPDAKEVILLLDRAQHRLREQETGRAIDELAAGAKRMAKAGQWVEAISTLEEGLVRYPDSEQLLNARRRLVEMQARAGALSEARSLRAGLKLEEADRLLDGALKRFPADSELLELRRQIGSDLEGQRRRDEVEGAAGWARAQIESGRLESATEILKATLAKYPGEASLTELLREYEEALRTHRREQALMAAREQAERFASQGRLDDAITLLERTAGEGATQELLARLRSQRDEKRRQEELEMALAARSRDLHELDAIGKKVPSAGKSRLKALGALAQQVSARYPSDTEMAGRAAGVNQQIAASLGREQRKPIAWGYVGLGLGAAGVAVLGIVVEPHFSHPKPGKIAVVALPVQVRTDPPGALVRIGQKSCSTPDCHFDLPPGQYRVEARLEGYQPVLRTFTAAAGVNNSASWDITLEPIPAPRLSGQNGSKPAPAVSALSIQTHVPDALIYVDNTPRGRTDATGAFHTEAPAGPHLVRVEKNGYLSPPPQSANPEPGKMTSLVFGLKPRDAELQLHGAPTGVEIRLGSTLLGRSAGSGVFSVAVPPGDRTLQIAQSGQTRALFRSFQPGEQVPMEWSAIAPPEAVKAPPVTVPVSPEAREAQAWEAVRGGADPQTVAAFLASYPNGAHADQAKARLQDLAWQRVDQNNAGDLRAYAARFPSSSHSPNALSALAELDWKGLDKSDAPAVRAFVSHHADSPHSAEAEQLAAKLESLARADDRRLQEDRAGVRSTLDRFNSAFEKRQVRELKQVWPGVPSLYTDSMNTSGGSFAQTLRPLEEAEINGDIASIHCELTTRTRMPGGQEKQNRKSVVVALRRSGDHWTITDPLGTH